MLLSSCCCGSCGDIQGAVRPYSETNLYAYEVSDFNLPYGPDTFLSTWRYTDVNVTLTQSAATVVCDYLELGCCGTSVIVDTPEGPVTCFQTAFNPVNEPAPPRFLPTFEFVKRKLQCPSYMNLVDQTFYFRFGCHLCKLYQTYCDGDECSNNDACVGSGSKGTLNGMAPAVARFSNGGVVGGIAGYWGGVEDQPIQTDPVLIGQGVAYFNRINAPNVFSTNIVNNNGNLLAVNYLHRANMQFGAGCEGQEALLTDVSCPHLCPCQSVVRVRTQLTGNTYYQRLQCDPVTQELSFTTQVNVKDPQQIILVYAGPMDSQLYLGAIPSSPVRTFKLLEAKIQDIGALPVNQIAQSYFKCDETSPSGNYDIKQCSVGVATTTEVTGDPIECEYYCGDEWIPNINTGALELYRVVNAEAAMMYGFPATITVTRISP